jgi:hypothetical protein
LELVSLDVVDEAFESELGDEEVSEEEDEVEEEDSCDFGFVSDVVAGAAVVPLEPELRWSVL